MLLGIVLDDVAVGTQGHGWCARGACQACFGNLDGFITGVALVEQHVGLDENRGEIVLDIIAFLLYITTWPCQALVSAFTEDSLECIVEAVLASAKARYP